MPTRKALGANNLDVIKGGEWRAFMQRWGANPAFEYAYIGRFTFDDVAITRAAAERVDVPSDDVRGEHTTVAQIFGELEDGTLPFTGKASRWVDEDFWSMVEYAEEGAVVQLLIGSKGAQNMTQWDSKLIAWNASVTGVTIGESKANQEKADEAVNTIAGEFAYWILYRVQRLVFADIIAATLLRKINDGTFRVVDRREEGWKFYFLMDEETGVNPSRVIVYDPFWKDTPKTIDPAVLGSGVGSKAAERCFVVGDDLVLLSNANNSHIYGALEDVDEGTDAFSEVTGYTAAKQPKSLYDVSSNEIYVVGVGGYIYRVDGVNFSPVIVDAGVLTTNDLNDIHGHRNQLIAVGLADTVLKSLDSGVTWQTAVATGGGNALTTVFVHSKDVWFIGDAAGGLYYTRDAGATYTPITLPDNLSQVNQISFSNQVCGFLIGTVTGAPDKSYVYRTTDSGRTWRRAKPDFDNMTVPVSYERGFAPDQNHIIAVGEVTAAGAGIVGYAKPN